MAKDKQYTSKDIDLLSDRDHVRIRLPVYAGNTKYTEYEIPHFDTQQFALGTVGFIPAAYKCINEVLDNCIDELTQTTGKNKTIIFDHTDDGLFTIADNGRGVPIDKHKTGKYTPEVVFGSLRSGRNFAEGKEAGVIGQNGMGSSISNYCSTQFDVTINREGKKYTQQFKNGADKISKPKIIKGPARKTGTQIDFQLDPSVFEDTNIPKNLLVNRAMEIAFNNPAITVNYNGTKYKYSNGLEDLVKTFSNQYFKFDADGMEFFVILDVHKGMDEKIFTWVNSSLLYDGGLCNTQFLNAFYDTFITNTKSIAKRNKTEITKNDIRYNLLVLGTLKVADPQYDAQSKTRLTGPNLRKEIAGLVSGGWKSFARKNKSFIEDVVSRASARHSKDSTDKLAKDLERRSKKKVPGLLDATHKIRYDCKLLVTEGDSAAGMIADVRDPKTTGAIALTGKINNVYTSTVAQVGKMTKIINLLNAIGLTPGRRAVKENLKFGYIIIATDADPDGGDIFTLLVNLFYKFWPELFDPNKNPTVFRLVAPNVVVSKGKKRIHFSTLQDFEKQKHKYKSGWEVEYFKGLGSMQRVDWESIMDNMEDHLIPIQDDGNMKDTLELLFSNNTENRKLWLA